MARAIWRAWPTANVDVYVEGLQADPDFLLTYNYVDAHGRPEASASIHIAIAQLSTLYINGPAVHQMKGNGGSTP